MKKLFTLGFLVLILASCNRNLTEEKYLEQNKKIEKSLVEIKLMMANKGEPQSFIVVNNSVTSSFPNWLSDQQNKTAITLQLPNGKYLVDLRLIFDSNGINTERVVADWLARYSSHINYNDSNLFIETAHIINHPIDLKIIGRINPQDFRNININTYMQSNSIADNQFSTYLKISMDGNFTLTHGAFDDRDKIFAAPLFKSIIANHADTDVNVRFRFAIVEFRGDDTIIMEAYDAGHSDKHIGYYDFSHRPRYVIP